MIDLHFQTRAFPLTHVSSSGSLNSGVDLFRVGKWELGKWLVFQDVSVQGSYCKELSFLGDVKILSRLVRQDTRFVDKKVDAHVHVLYNFLSWG